MFDKREMNEKWIIQELADDTFSASSEFNSKHSAKFARLNFKKGNANWSAKHNDHGEWLQVDLCKKRSITAVSVQGRFNQPQWVTKYNLLIGNDAVNWQNFENIEGSRDQETAVIYYLPRPTQGRFVRFVPTSWQGHISMRVDICILEADHTEKDLLNAGLITAAAYKITMNQIDFDTDEFQVNYKMRINIDEGDNPRFVDIKLGSNPTEVEGEDSILIDFYNSADFRGLDQLLESIEPHNQFVDFLRTKYSKGSKLRNITVELDKNEYEGALGENGQKNGPGILRIKSNHLNYFSSCPFEHEYIALIGKWVSDKLIEGEIRVYADKDFESDFTRFEVKNVKTDLGGRMNFDQEMDVRDFKLPIGDTYTGTIKNFLMHGKGTVKKDDGTTEEGIWFEGQKHGTITVSDAEGPLITDKWEYGKLVLGTSVKLENQITGRKIVVAGRDFPNKMTWEEAKSACQDLGRGWRLPTKIELDQLYQNKDIISGIYYDYHFSSTEESKYNFWCQNFFNGEQLVYSVKYVKCYVRAVKTI
jgi:hypothetical protein